jgi:two-component system, cell cycle sensor histidine kinase and response regulator CckA
MKGAAKKNVRPGEKTTRRRTAISQHGQANSSSGGKDELLTFYLRKNYAFCQHIPTALCLLGSDGKILFSNSQLESLTGFNNHELLNKNIAGLLNVPGYKDLLEFMGKSIKSAALPLDIELIRKDETKIWVTFNISSFLQEKTNEHIFIASIIDVTNSKHIADELSLCHDLLEAAPDSIFLRDQDGKFRYINAAAYRERGYEHDELIKSNIFQIVSPEFHDIMRDNAKTLSARGAVTFEATHKKKDGTIYPVEVHMSPVEHAGEKLILNIVHNVSQRKRIEEELVRALKMESVAMVTGGVASQFNTLLTHIIGNLNVLVSESDPGNPQYKLLQETTKYSDRALDLVKHLMCFSDSGSQVRKITSISGLIRDISDYIISGSNIWCNYFIADDLYKVELTESQFVQAFSNVITNATQSMPKGGIIKISACNVKLEANEITGLPRGEYVKISIEDRGHGIKSEHLPCIFDPYFTTLQGKVGLGLSIAYSIIKNHGGTIKAESKYGSGSTFDLFLPRAHEREGTKKTVSDIDTSVVKMLVVDDEQLVMNVGSRLLSSLGYSQVKFAVDGVQALKEYREALESGKGFDVVIIDLSIPGKLSGQDVIKSLIAMDPKANILISGGYFNDPIVTDFRRYGIKGVLAKPYPLEELEHIVHKRAAV